MPATRSRRSRRPNWWQNLTAWLTQTDADWCYWHLGGTHVKGTEPATNRLIYSKDDRCADGVFAQDWQGPSSPYYSPLFTNCNPQAPVQASANRQTRQNTAKRIKRRTVLEPEQPY